MNYYIVIAIVLILIIGVYYYYSLEEEKTKNKVDEVIKKISNTENIEPVHEEELKDTHTGVDEHGNPITESQASDPNTNTLIPTENISPAH